MKDLLADAITSKFSSTLESLGGAMAVYGDPVQFGDEQIIPVARVGVVLSAGAEGAGGGNAGLTGGITNMARGGGGGNANASVQVSIEPVGFLRPTPGGPVFCPLES